MVKLGLCGTLTFHLQLIGVMGCDTLQGPGVWPGCP